VVSDGTGCQTRATGDHRSAPLGRAVLVGVASSAARGTTGRGAEACRLEEREVVVLRPYPCSGRGAREQLRPVRRRHRRVGMR